MAEIDRETDSQSGTAGRRVLLVDDSEDLRELYETLLTYEGYEVKTAPSAEEALKIVRAWRPSLVVTDLLMPGIGGLELITRLCSDFAPPIPPIVVFSGVSEAKDEALKRGAVRFETKPVGPQELLRIVEDAFAPERAVWVRPPNAVSERRVASRAIGEAILSRFIIETPGFLDKLGVTALILARFFGQFTTGQASHCKDKSGGVFRCEKCEKYFPRFLSFSSLRRACCGRRKAAAPSRAGLPIRAGP